MSALVTAAAAGCAAALWPRSRAWVTSVAQDARGGQESITAGPKRWWLIRYRGLLSAAAGAGAWVVIGGNAGIVAAVVGAVVCWVVIGRAEPESVRRRRAALRAELPVIVRLVGAGLRSGLAPGEAVLSAVDALPGAGSDALGPQVRSLRLGADPAEVWRRLLQDPGLAPLARALLRAHESGASVATVIERLADELAREARGAVEDQARRVGVKAAVPLGLCLLPAFLLIGIVPVVGGLIGSLGL